MRRSSLVISLIFLSICLPLIGANRITTWSSGNILTASALNGEFNNLFTGTIDRTAGRWGQNNDITLTFGTSQNVSQRWSTVQTNAALLTGLAGSFTWIIHNDANSATNYAYAIRTNPALIIKSNTVTAANYLELQHNDTDAVINAGGGGIDFQTAATRRMFLTGTSLTLTDDLLFIDATYDIGKSGATRPRDFFISRNATIGGALVVTGTGPSAVGGGTTTEDAFLVRGAYTTTGLDVYGIRQTQSLTATANRGLYGIYLAATLIESASGVHPTEAGLYVNPTVTNGAATATDFAGVIIDVGAAAAGTTNASGLKILAAPTGATNNRALWVVAGDTQLGGNVGVAMVPVRALDVTGTFGATGAATLGSTLTVTGTSTFTGKTTHNGGVSATSGITAVLTGNQNGNVTGSTTSYTNFVSRQAFDATEGNVQFAIPFAATVKNFYVITTTSQGAGGTCVFTIRKNAVDTTIVVTVPASGAAATRSDTTNTATFVAGDKISIKVVNNDAGPSATIQGLSIQIDSTG